MPEPPRPKASLAPPANWISALYTQATEPELLTLTRPRSAPAPTVESIQAHSSTVSGRLPAKLQLPQAGMDEVMGGGGAAGAGLVGAVVFGDRAGHVVGSCCAEHCGLEVVGFGVAAEVGLVAGGGAHPPVVDEVGVRQHLVDVAAGGTAGARPGMGSAPVGRWSRPWMVCCFCGISSRANGLSS